MEPAPILEPRGYQVSILNRVVDAIARNRHVLIELDCGLGKRFLQYSLLEKQFPEKRILLILQASTSLYETYEYLIKYISKSQVSIIDSRTPSFLRAQILQSSRIILTLPQTLQNTLSKYGDAIKGIELVIINEVDQIVKRMATSTNFKHPYPKLMGYFHDKTIVGMSGTLRDHHYILDQDQLRVREELQTIFQLLQGAELITMDSLSNTDISKHISMTRIIPTAVDDFRLAMVSIELEQLVNEAKEKVLSVLKEYNPQLYEEVKQDYSKLFGPLPIPPSLAQKFHRGYLVRKYLWSMPGTVVYKHLLNYGMDQNYLKNSLPRVPGKFQAVKKLVNSYSKTVILCSYLSTVETLESMLSAIGIETVKITGQVPHNERVKSLDHFRQKDGQIVALLSNVGERDLDIPEAELLIIFDLIRTTKTVYQKLKRSRGGICRILYYHDTKEQQKVANVLQQIKQRYSWSTEVLSNEKVCFTD